MWLVCLELRAIVQTARRESAVTVAVELETKFGRPRHRLACESRLVIDRESTRIEGGDRLARCGKRAPSRVTHGTDSAAT